jgi:hypothetical protein
MTKRSLSHDGVLSPTKNQYCLGSNPLKLTKLHIEAQAANNPAAADTQ